MVSVPSTSPKEATANQHTGKARPSLSSPQDMTTATNTDRILKGDHMTTIHPTSRDTYVTAYHAELSRILSNRRTVNGHDVDDVISFAVLRLLKKYDSIVAKNPDPIVFARRSIRNLGHDFHRREAVQRGEGARNERAIGSLDVGVTTDASGGVVPDFSAGYVDDIERMQQIEKISAALTPEQMRLLTLVDGHDMTVSEVAKIVGLRRETVSRKVSKARTHARKTLGPAA
jgi:RNA polymerase sigma factor (sigma-70 family)